MLLVADPAAVAVAAVALVSTASLDNFIATLVGHGP